MKYLKSLLIVLFALAVTSSALLIGTHAQGQSTALERGFRTGYSDGYSAGSRDIADQVARNYQNKDDYQHGDRGYNEAWGTAELQLSFETIHLRDGRTTEFNADVVELVNAGNRDDTGTVDSEGGVRSKSSTKDEIAKVVDLRVFKELKTELKK